MGKVRSVVLERYLGEYITREVVSIRDYLSMDEKGRKEYLPLEYHDFFDDFLNEEDIDFEMPTTPHPEYGQIELSFNDSYELVEHLEEINHKIYAQFADYLYQKIIWHELPIPDSEYPAWTYFSEPSLVKNQWLLHFTDYADKIASEGFNKGVDDMTKLGLTTQIDEFDKELGGYNFAYTLEDFRKYAYNPNRPKGYKYGGEAVIFRASGIKSWHNSDDEYQVIFYGNTAKDIIPITEGLEDDWSLRDKRTDDILFESNDLEDVVDWLVDNYAQYRKRLH